jgi:diguanylate cyclase (GGDEF)-like protein
MLFALSEPDLIIQQFSNNVSALLGKSADALSGCSLETVLGECQFEKFRSKVLNKDSIPVIPIRLPGSALEMNCIPHRHDGALVVEFEFKQGASSLDQPLDIDAHLRGPFTRLELAADIIELSRLAACEVQSLSGFERVMVYRFDDEWGGEVISEVTGPSLPSYLGHRFPSSDIPHQARRLFLTNPLRTIADVAATPVPIIPVVGPLTGRALDLTRSFLRSASPVHIEYLRNMGVQSSLTVSIIVKQKLWGMIACHHAKPRRVDCSIRSACELLGQVLASQIALRTDNASLRARLTSRNDLVKYMAGIEASKVPFHTEHFQNARLLDLFGADGMISHIDGAVSSEGAVVEEELLLPVIDKLRELASRGIASCNMLSTLDHRAASYAIRASGALYIGLKDGAGDYLLFLRRELVETVVWAGNPEKTATEDERGGLRPRASFASWEETLHGRGRPWTELELEAACFLREQLLRMREAKELSRLNEALESEIEEHKKAQEELRKSKSHLTYSAEHDFLTGLPNRILLNDRFAQAIALASRHGTRVAVLFLDLDGFKHINDSLGHAIGDKLLQSVSVRLVECVRGSDTVSRQGGDEFVILLSEVEQSEDAAISSRRILAALASPHSIDGRTLHVNASIGVSVYPDDGTDVETLIKNSDTAMYQAKENGRRRYQFFKPAMNVRAVERQFIEESLQRALEQHEFMLHYQPIIYLRTREIVGAEALLRWTHPLKGPISPAQFIPVAEDSGLILPIGNWVLREACKQARSWMDAGLALSTIAVNISAMEFRDENFLEGVFAALRDTGLDPSALHLELTESVLMKHPESTRTILKSLRESGVHVSVDDFGTGYSGLSYLRKFPIDAIKIDQSFVHQLTACPDDATIVAAIIGMGRSLNLRVVAEGVETLEELEFLQHHMCEEAQGYCFSRPVSPSEFAKLLETGIPMADGVEPIRR